MMIRPYSDVTWEAEQLYRAGAFDHAAFLRLRAEARQAVKGYPEEIQADLVKNIDMYAPIDWVVAAEHSEMVAG